MLVRLADVAVLTVASCNLQGETPPLQAALDLYHILSESDTDLRQPVGLEKQLLSEYSLDADVGQSMLQLLQV